MELVSGVDLQRRLAKIAADAARSVTGSALATDQTPRHWTVLVQGSYIRTVGHRLISRARADRLRANAELAGLIRPQLWENSKARRHLTVHDLRATFITVSLANGMTEAWITDRTGHQDSATLYQYKRQARTHAELNLGPCYRFTKRSPSSPKSAPRLLGYQLRHRLKRPPFRLPRFSLFPPTFTRKP